MFNVCGIWGFRVFELVRGTTVDRFTNTAIVLSRTTMTETLVNDL